MFRAIKSFLGLDDEPTTARPAAARPRLGCESLERREMLDAKLVGTMLMITGTTGNDTVTVTEGNLFGTPILSVDLNGNKYLFPRSGVQNMHSNLWAGDDRFVNHTGFGGLVRGGDGNDYLRGGFGADSLYGEGGDDTMISLDHAVDTLYGNAGFDSFWVNGGSTRIPVSDTIADAEASEVRNVHRIGSFANGADLTPNGDRIADPTDIGQTMRVDGPLFAPRLVAPPFINSPGGPTADDVRQGSLGDCWMLASLSATADTSPNAIRQTIVELGDSTYAVELGGKFYRVDNDLPVNSTTVTGGRYDLRYARQGALNSLWVPLVEKAYAHFRTGANTYASLNGGNTGETLTALGATDVSSLWKSDISGQGALNHIASQFAQGRTVTMGIYDPPSDLPLVGSHAYMVDRVNRDAQGNVISVVLRNPWGIDGGGGSDGQDDGYVTITANMLNRTGDWAIRSGKFA